MSNRRSIRFTPEQNARFLEAYDAYVAEFGACSQEQFIRERTGASSPDERGNGRVRGTRPRQLADFQQLMDIVFYDRQGRLCRIHGIETRFLCRKSKDSKRPWDPVRIATEDEIRFARQNEIKTGLVCNANYDPNNTDDGGYSDSLGSSETTW